MSEALLIFARRFVRGDLDAPSFTDAYIQQWKVERDSGLLISDDAQVSEALSSIFCLADLFNPDHDRAQYEFDEVRLRSKVAKNLRDIASL
jgi:hypothetical protein